MPDRAMPTPIAVIGGGFLGRALVERLLGEHGFDRANLVVTSRSGKWRHAGAAALPPPQALDLTAPNLRLGAVSNAAAVVIAVAPSAATDRRALYVEGTRRLLAGLGTNLRRVVFVGSTSALADADAWVHEDDQAPPDARGQIQRDAEVVVREFAQARGVPWLILRLGGLYGPGRGLDRIYARRQPGALPGDGHAPTNLVHVEDAVTAALAALSAPASCSGIVHVCDDDHRTRRSMYAAMAKACAAAPVTWAEPEPNGPPRGKRVSNLRLKTWLGVRLAHPHHVLAPLPAARP